MKGAWVLQPVMCWILLHVISQTGLLSRCRDHLQSLLIHRNEAYSKWIGTGNPEDIVTFKN